MSKPLNTNFTIHAPSPIDSRLQVDTYASLAGIPVKYNHMVVNVEDTDEDWKYYAAGDNWVEVTAGASGAATWGSITGVLTDQSDLIAYLVANFADIAHTHPQLPPLAHTHVEADITDLDKYTQAEVDDLVKHRNPYDTGLIAGGFLSINADTTKFDVSEGIFIYKEFSAADPFVEPITHEVDFSESLAVTPTFLASHPATYVGITFVPGPDTITVVQSSTPFSAISLRTVTFLGVLHHPDNTNITFISNQKTTPINGVNQLTDLINSLGSFKVSGNEISANGANLSLNKSVGDIFALGINYDTSSKNPHISTILLGSAFSFAYRTQTGTEGSSVTTVDPNNYDNAGSVTAMTAGNWSIQRVYLFPSGELRLQYGQTQYASKDAALVVLASESFVLEQNISENAIFLAYILVQQGATDLSDTAEAVIYNTDKWGRVIQPLQSVTSDRHYTHTQVGASTTWTIPHNLGKYPSVRCKDGSGNNLHGDITDVDTDNMTITFNTAVAGVAYLN